MPDPVAPGLALALGLYGRPGLYCVGNKECGLMTSKVPSMSNTMSLSLEKVTSQMAINVTLIFLKALILQIACASWKC